MFEQKKLSDMLERWLDELLEFNFEVAHIPGVLNVLPDCLSRLYAVDSPHDFHAKAALLAASAPSIGAEDGVPVGLPCPPWDDFVVTRRSDWLPIVPFALGGGGVPNVDTDTDQLWDVLCIGEQVVPTPSSSDRRVCTASSLPPRMPLSASEGVPGPVLDAIPSDSQIPIALSKLGEVIEVTPEDQRQHALDWAHAQGHKGSRGTLHRLLSEGYKWPGMEKDCLRVAQSCVDCQRFTTQRFGFHPLRAVVADLPMDHLAVDLAQMKVSSCGMSYILVVLDICTRFVWLYPLKDKAGLTVAAALKSLFTTFGKPLYIQSDNGSEFVNLDFQQLMAAVGVEHRRVLPCYPQANGAAERAIRSIKESLNATIRGDTASWPQHLSSVQYWYNTTVHRRHGSTPFSLFFARSHNPWRQEPDAPQGKELSSKHLLARNKFMSDIVFPAVGARTRSYAEGVFKGFAQRHKIINDDYPAGALVMKQVLPRGSKMLPTWEGPYMVILRSRSGGYVLRDTLNEELVHKVPASQLRLVSYEGTLSPDSFEVDHVVSHRGNPGRREYLIRWKGFSADDDSWVGERDINTLGCITEYWDVRRGKKTAEAQVADRGDSPRARKRAAVEPAGLAARPPVTQAASKRTRGSRR
jgi:transposase InsO family protein